jgi:hypothetical protein
MSKEAIWGESHALSLRPANLVASEIAGNRFPVALSERVGAGRGASTLLALRPAGAAKSADAKKARRCGHRLASSSNLNE